MTEIRYLKETDKEIYFKFDRHLSEKEFSNKVRDNMGYLMVENGVPIAVLRYSLFWDTIPFCNLIYIDEKSRRKGYGRKLMRYWEADMLRLGYEIVMTSTQSDETAQHFYRMLGYRENGSMIFDIHGYEQPLELFFIKKL